MAVSASSVIPACRSVAVYTLVSSARKPSQNRSHGAKHNAMHAANPARKSRRDACMVPWLTAAKCAADGSSRQHVCQKTPPPNIARPGGEPPSIPGRAYGYGSMQSHPKRRDPLGSDQLVAFLVAHVGATRGEVEPDPFAKVVQLRPPQLLGE